MAYLISRKYNGRTMLTFERYSDAPQLDAIARQSMDFAHLVATGETLNADQMSDRIDQNYGGGTPDPKTAAIIEGLRTLYEFDCCVRA